MAEEYIELVRRSILGWNERGVEALLDVVDPEVEFHPPKESLDPGIYRGHDGFREYFRRVGEIVENQRVGDVEVIDMGDDRVIATVRASASSSTSIRRSRPSGPGS